MSPPITRRHVLAGTSAMLAASAVPIRAAPADARFARRRGTALRLAGERYLYVGTNMWYAAYLGADAPYGDRARLQRELDRLPHRQVGRQ